jgi:hypothetical protein
MEDDTGGTGNRKYGLAAMLVGGAITAERFDIALAGFGLYILANILERANSLRKR